jgi:hypothetical protein
MCGDTRSAQRQRNEKSTHQAQLARGLHRGVMRLRRRRRLTRAADQARRRLGARRGGEHVGVGVSLGR